MIIDNLENLMQYAPLNPLIEEVWKFMQTHDWKNMANGHYEIILNRLFVNIEDDKGKQKDEAVIEYHRKMIDIQVPMNYCETYGYIPVRDLPKVPFDTEKDIAKVLNAHPRCYVTLLPGEFAIFFPQDGHAPCISEGKLHKAVFKLAVQG